MGLKASRVSERDQGFRANPIDPMSPMTGSLDGCLPDRDCPDPTTVAQRHRPVG